MQIERPRQNAYNSGLPSAAIFLFYIYIYIDRWYRYLHTNFHEDWRKKLPDFFHLKQASILFGPPCTDGAMLTMIVAFTQSWPQQTGFEAKTKERFQHLSQVPHNLGAAFSGNEIRLGKMFWPLCASPSFLLALSCHLIGFDFLFLPLLASFFPDFSVDAWVNTRQ